MSAVAGPTLADFAGRDTLTVEEAGQVLRLSRASAYEAVHRGDIPTFRIGRRLLVPKRALATMLGFADSTIEEASGTHLSDVEEPAAA